MADLGRSPLDGDLALPIGGCTPPKPGSRHNAAHGEWTGTRVLGAEPRGSCSAPCGGRFSSCGRCWRYLGRQQGDRNRQATRDWTRVTNAYRQPKVGTCTCPPSSTTTPASPTPSLGADVAVGVSEDPARCLVRPSSNRSRAPEASGRCSSGIAGGHHLTVRSYGRYLRAEGPS